MSNGTNVLILEDDLYACDFMAMLLVRDWRTRVVESIGSIEELPEILEQTDKAIDLVLIDTEVPEHTDWLPNASDAIKDSAQPDCAILCTGTKPHAETLRQIIKMGGRGYIMKGEIGYALPAAARYAAGDQWVATPAVERMACDNDIRLPHGSLILTSSIDWDPLTPREREIGKLSILFQLSQLDLQDELHLSRDYIAECVRNFCEKIGLHHIFEDVEYPLDELFESELVKRLFREGQERTTAGKRVKNKSTLAFHLLTCVNKREYSRFDC